MFQRIRRRTPVHTQTGIYKREPRKRKKVRKHTDTLTPTKYSFSLATHSNFGIGGSVAGATPVRHSSFLSILRIKIQEDDFILDDLIWLTIWTSSDFIDLFTIKKFFNCCNFFAFIVSIVFFPPCIRYAGTGHVICKLRETTMWYD